MKNAAIWAVVVILGVLSFFADDIALNVASALQNSALTFVMTGLSDISTFVIVVVLTSLIMWRAQKMQWVRSLWLSLITAAFLSLILKMVFARARPDIYSGFILTQFAFPSMHAALAFSLIPVLGKEFPKLRLLWISFAVLVSISRIYLGAHYLSDVVWGAILGFSVGKIVIWLQESKKLEWL